MFFTVILVVILWAWDFWEHSHVKTACPVILLMISCPNWINLATLNFLSAVTPFTMFRNAGLSGNEEKISTSRRPWLCCRCCLSQFLISYEILLIIILVDNSKIFFPILSYARSKLGLKLTIWTFLHLTYQLILPAFLCSEVTSSKTAQSPTHMASLPNTLKGFG